MKDSQFDFTNFNSRAVDDSDHLSEAYVGYVLRNESMDRALFFNRLWQYYRNEYSPLGISALDVDSERWVEHSRPYYQAQEYGLPARITGLSHLGYGGAGVPAGGLKRKEVVIENDIGWRIDAGVHFLFGQAVEIESLAADPARRKLIEDVLRRIYRQAGPGGKDGFFQEMALLGSVYGFVDVVVRFSPGANVFREADPSGAGRWFVEEGSIKREVNPADFVVPENLEAPRVIPILDEDNYRKIRYHIQHYTKVLSTAEAEGSPPRGGEQKWLVGKPPTATVTEILGPHWWQRYEEGRLVSEGENILGRLPVIHIQNLPLPMYYAGVGDVEPLMPIQDEINTRLSDRANRVTFQSFKMYLGKGIDNFEDRPVAPGRMWSTNNPDASIEAFGGDADCPSENAHIAELREAMDKMSGITPLAAGLLRDRLGNLTSAAALRVTLMGTLAKVNRKRITYGQSIVELNRLLLELLDRIGALKTDEEERETKVHWPSPIPENTREKLEEAQMKRNLGISTETILRELGYQPE